MCVVTRRPKRWPNVSALSICVILQYAAQLADLRLLPQAFAYLLACAALATKARADRRASGLAYDPDALLATAQELHARLQAHAAATGASQAPAGRGIMGRVGSFLDNKVMSLLATDESKGVSKSASAASLTGQARRQGASRCLHASARRVLCKCMLQPDCRLWCY